MIRSMLNDMTRCQGIGCHQRLHCLRYTAPVPENALLSWVSTLNPERTHMCPEIIYGINESHD